MVTVIAADAKGGGRKPDTVPMHEIQGGGQIRLVSRSIAVQKGKS